MFRLDYYTLLEMSSNSNVRNERGFKAVDVNAGIGQPSAELGSTNVGITVGSQYLIDIARNILARQCGMNGAVVDVGLTEGLFDDPCVELRGQVAKTGPLPTRCSEVVEGVGHVEGRGRSMDLTTG